MDIKFQDEGRYRVLRVKDMDDEDYLTVNVLQSWRSVDAPFVVFMTSHGVPVTLTHAQAGRLGLALLKEVAR